MRVTLFLEIPWNVTNEPTGLVWTCPMHRYLVSLNTHSLVEPSITVITLIPPTLWPLFPSVLIDIEKKSWTFSAGAFGPVVLHLASSSFSRGSFFHFLRRRWIILTFLLLLDVMLPEFAPDLLLGRVPTSLFHRIAFEIITMRSSIL